MTTVAVEPEPDGVRNGQIIISSVEKKVKEKEDGSDVAEKQNGAQLEDG